MRYGWKNVNALVTQMVQELQTHPNLQQLGNLATSILIKEKKLKTVQQKIARLITPPLLNQDETATPQTPTCWTESTAVHPAPGVSGFVFQKCTVSDGSSTSCRRSLSITESASEDADKGLPMERSRSLLPHKYNSYSLADVRSSVNQNVSFEYIVE